MVLVWFVSRITNIVMSEPSYFIEVTEQNANFVLCDLTYLEQYLSYTSITNQHFLNDFYNFICLKI